VKGQTPDNSFLATTKAIETWYFVRWHVLINSTAPVSAGIFFDSLPTGQVVLLYDLRLTKYPVDSVRSVGPGNLKFTVSVYNWIWCNPCQNENKFETGDLLDYTFNVKVKNNASVTLTSLGDEGMIAHVGSLYDMYLSNYVQITTDPQKMPVGYPLLNTQANNNYFTVRWWKEGGAPAYVYDPVIYAIAYPPGEEESKSKTLAIVLGTTLPFACLIYVLVAYWIYQRRKKSSEETQPINNHEEKKSSTSENDPSYQPLPNQS